MLIRTEEPRDGDAVRRLNEAAFVGREEADLVEALHAANAAIVALVADLDGEIVGHILFSPVSLEPALPRLWLGLAPTAVAPRLQKQGIGTLLVREGLERSRDAGAEAVVVLGHPQYYPRFGFRPAHEFGLRCEYDVPSDVFMALELVPGALRGVFGVVRYHPAFSEVS